MTLVSIPDLVTHLNTGGGRDWMRENLRWSLGPEETRIRNVATVNDNDLIAQLSEADQQWQPKEEILPDGSTRYLYKRREGEPDLSIGDLRQLMESPLSFAKERQEILTLLRSLRRAGVVVAIEKPLKKGAAAEWDHALGTLRIDPKMIHKGSIDFLHVLTHEAVHVAQSCKAGSLTSKPKALGVPLPNKSQLQSKLNDPVYSNATHWEQKLEMEAYSLQTETPKVKISLDKSCNVAQNQQS